MSSIQKALEIAFDCHKGQKRKCNNAPYIVHILDVTKLLLFEPSATENIIIAGILHDTLEDTSYNPSQLKEDFGPDILELVQFITEPEKNITASKEERMHTWKQRKQHTLEACKTANHGQMLILLADKLSNLQSIKDDLLISGDNLWSYFNAPKDDICWYYHELGNIFSRRIGNSRLYKLYNEILFEVFPDY